MLCTLIAFLKQVDSAVLLYAGACASKKAPGTPCPSTLITSPPRAEVSSAALSDVVTAGRSCYIGTGRWTIG